MLSYIAESGIDAGKNNFNEGFSMNPAESFGGSYVTQLQQKESLEETSEASEKLGPQKHMCVSSAVTLCS